MAERFNISDQIAQARAVDEFTERVRREATPKQVERVERAIVRGSLRYYEGLERARRLANGERD